MSTGVSANLRRWAAALCTCVALAHVGVRGEEKQADVPPEIRAKCTEFLKKVVAAQRKHLDKRMATEIEEIVKVTGLGQDGVKALQAASGPAEDAAQADLLEKALALYVKAYAKTSGRGLEGLDRPDLVEALANMDSGFDLGVRYTRALDQPAWKEALVRALTPEQAAVLQKSQDAKTAATSKEFDDLLDKQADQVRTAISSPMFTKSTEIIDALGLPKDRADAITDLAKKAIDASMTAWREDSRKLFLSNDETTRAQVMRGMRFNAAPKEEDAPENQSVWTQGIAKLLTDDDRAKLLASHGTQRKRRTHALAMLMVAMLDEKIAFTAKQRPELEPFMERLVQTVDAFYPQNDNNNNDYLSLNPDLFYKAAGKAKPEELRPILDDLQWKHWQELGRQKRVVNEDFDDDRQPTPGPVKPDPTAIEEPEDLERFVSDYLQGKAAEQQKELDAAMILQAEDAARVAGLPPETAERLRTAAHGAAEISLAAWCSSFEQSVRAQTQGATRETVQQRLGSQSRGYYGKADARELVMWKQAVKTGLTQAQQDAWQSERDARERYNDDATAQFILAEFDRSFVLSVDQWERLAPLLAQSIREYRPEISRMFSYNTPQWFLTSYYMFLPMHAIPEADCKTIIGKERFDRWTESNGYRFSVQYWGNIKDSRDRRNKETKK